jgi:hypothetical protein
MQTLHASIVVLRILSLWHPLVLTSDVRHVTPRLMPQLRNMARKIETLAPSCRVSVHDGDVVPFVLYVSRARAKVPWCMHAWVCVNFSAMSQQHTPVAVCKCGRSLSVAAGLCIHEYGNCNGTERVYCTSTHAGWKAGRMGR